MVNGLFAIASTTLDMPWRPLSFSANLLGWKVTWLNAVSDPEIARLLGFDQTQWPEFEAEHPELLCFVHRSGEEGIPRDLPSEIISECAGLGGTPMRASDFFRHSSFVICPPLVLYLE